MMNLDGKGEVGTCTLMYVQLFVGDNIEHHEIIQIFDSPFHLTVQFQVLRMNALPLVILDVPVNSMVTIFPASFGQVKPYSSL